MRINAVGNVNYNRGLQQRKSARFAQTSTNNNSVDTVSFKGLKGATIGAAVGTAVGGALLGAATIFLAPYVVVGLLDVGLLCGAGALVGHNIESDFKQDKEQDERNK